MEKFYDPKKVEPRLYEEWENSGAFSSDDTFGDQTTREKFSIVIPPPNVTGSLHIGHALNNTLQDILARYYRMKGCDVLWQPGMDHAGIATQMVVERQLAEENIFLARGNQQSMENKCLLGRDQFLKKVWEWKAKSGGTILNQLRRLGASCDWKRERFTMDEGLSQAVRSVFVSLYREGIIYRDKRLVNWDPKFHTAISDLEVEQRETKGNLWYFRYPLEGSTSQFITVATTRPETMLGDTAVAVHPDDKRFEKFIGKSIRLPIVGRIIPIIADEYSDPEKGSGAVKITPAHDFNDFEVGKRHNLEMVSIFDESGNVNHEAPNNFQGMDRFDARKKIIDSMDELGFLVKVEENYMTIPYGDRSGVVIEPRLTDQWFVNAKVLAQPAIEAVKSGKTKFVPKHWENTYFDWMKNIQPWCISRQIWWGHRIPVWYGPDGIAFVAETEREALEDAKKHYGVSTPLIQDDDVLDTWFSSALWSFSTLGWPQMTSTLSKYYPTNVLVTGFDIIFFWVARMMMMGLHFCKDIPFNTVYIHALVRDAQGQKMSKSKGNVLDPLEIIERYGADSLRFTLAAMAAQGRDIKLAPARIEGYRNFITKLWNAARYADMNKCYIPLDFSPSECKLILNKWIVTKLRETEQLVSNAILEYRFNDAANAIYAFTWHKYCDWYLEFSKSILNSKDGDAVNEVRTVTGWVLERILKILHPFIPFVTEEIWQNRNEVSGQKSALITSSWPDFKEVEPELAACNEIDWVITLISQIRAVRAEMNIPARAKLSLLFKNVQENTRALINRHAELLKQLARIKDIREEQPSSKETLQIVVDHDTFFLPLEGVINIAQEKTRLLRDIDKVNKEISKLQNKLSNKKFLTKAPTDVIDENRERLAEEVVAKNLLENAFKRLTGF